MILFSTTQNTQNLEAQSLAENVSCGKPFPLWYFDKKILEEVTHIPHDIDGICFYQITVSDHWWHGPTSDRQHFRMMTTTCKDFNGEVCLGFLLRFICVHKHKLSIQKNIISEPTEQSELEKCQRS